MEYVTIEQFHELKTITLFALSFAVVGVVGMLAGLAVNIRNSNTLRNARESQLHFFSKVDKLLDNQEAFRGMIKRCEKDLMEIKSTLMVLKGIGFDLQSAARSFETRHTNRNEANPKNTIKINRDGDNMQSGFFNGLLEERLKDSQRIERIEKQIQQLLKQMQKE